MNNSCIPKKLINTDISYILHKWPRVLNTCFTLGSCLFGSVTLSKNADLEKYKDSSHSIGFGSC